MMIRAVTRLWRRKKILSGIFLLLLGGVFYVYFFISSSSASQQLGVSEHDVDAALLYRGQRVEKNKESKEKSVEKERMDVNYNVFAFYYIWYGNMKFNGKFVHWSHPRLPHWNHLVGRSYSTAPHEPPDDIGANYYPEIGLYSSRDSSVIETHFQQMRRAGIGVVIVSWYPPHMADDQGVPTHFLIPRLLHFAAKFQLKIALHIEPYARREIVSMRRYIRLLGVENITSHSAYLQRDSKPVLFVYDSYRTNYRQWARLLTKTGDISIRGTLLDAYVVGLYFKDGDCRRFENTGFDGAYSYFGVDGFSAGSRTADWTKIREDCGRLGVDFIPCVAPGYDDTAVRPWNGENKRERENGKYYRKMFQEAMKSGASSIAITSFNEWHEGTQIEPAVPKNVKDPPRTYSDYEPNPPNFYIHLTRALVDEFSKLLKRPKT